MVWKLTNTRWSPEDTSIATAIATEMGFEVEECDEVDEANISLLARAVAQLRTESHATIARLTAERDEARAAVASAGFRIGPSLHAEPTLWCVECGRDSGYHWPGCSKDFAAPLAKAVRERDEARAEVARQSAARVAVDAAENAEVARLRALLASWLDDDDDGALWSDWPKRLSEDQREALACAWTGLPPGSCWVRAALATGEKGGG